MRCSFSRTCRMVGACLFAACTTGVLTGCDGGTAPPPPTGANPFANAPIPAAPPQAAAPPRNAAAGAAAGAPGAGTAASEGPQEDTAAAARRDPSMFSFEQEPEFSAASNGTDATAVRSEAAADPPEDRENWTRFRGPNGSGSIETAELPLTWSDSENLVWKQPLPGPGASSPIVYGDRVFVTCYKGYGENATRPGSPARLEQWVICLNRNTGRTLWSREAESDQRPPNYQGYITRHGYASSTPVTDGSRVYAFFGNAGVFAYTMDGRPDWTMSVGKGGHQWGSASSPILYRGLLILNATVESGSLGALRKDTGEVAWHIDSLKPGWGTPVIVQPEGGRPEVVYSTEGQIIGADPQNGTELWTCKGISDYVCPSLIAHDGVVYATGSRGGTTLAVRAGGRGDVTDTHLLWKAFRGSNVPSPVYHGGHLYWVNDKGVGYCVDAATGNVITEKRINSGEVYASALAVGDRLYVQTQQQGLLVLTATPEMEVLAENRFDSDDSTFNASPAVAGNQLFLRSEKFLYCVGDASAPAQTSFSAGAE